MSISLIGISVLQYNWIISSVRDLESRFDDNVNDILDKAKEYLERESRKNHTNPQDLDPIRRQFKSDVYSNPNNSIHLNELLKEALETREYVLEQTNKKDNSLASKIDKDALYDFINAEMAAHEIHSEFFFGIWSKKNQSFLIQENYYTVESHSLEVSPAFSLDEEELNSKRTYSRDIFGTINSPRAELIITFPNKREIIWKSAFRNLLLALLFIILILACFIYTINVILRQKKLSEMKTDFINNMTHEFKTPIATISLATDSIGSAKVIADPDRIKKFTKIIKQENKRMLNQVEKVLQIALLDRNKYNLKISDFDINLVIQQAVENTRLQVEKRGGTIEQNLMATKHIIQGDQTHIGNTIYNLLDNANKYSLETPKIIVHTRNLSNGIELTVEDHGIGLSKEAKKHVFEKFYRVHTGNVHDVKGFGLGLSYVKNIVDAHNGTVNLKSELNKGSKFILFFPFKQNVA